MDRIEELMKDAKPRVGVPGAAPGNDSVRSLVSSSDPDVVHLAHRVPARRNRLRAVAGTLVAAAAVIAAVVVGGNLMQPQAPSPAQSGIPTTAPATPSPSAPASRPPAPPTTAPATSAPAALTTGGVACTMANVDQQRSDQQRAIIPVPANERRYYTVLGCADGWLAYSTSDEGAKAMHLDGGNAWFNIGKLQNGRFLVDYQQIWSSVFNWEFQATNNQGLTPQQAMDKQFAAIGIPVQLRSRLVGDGPAGK